MAGPAEAVKEEVAETPAEPMDVFAEAFAQITADEPRKEVMPSAIDKSTPETSPQPEEVEAGGAQEAEPEVKEEPVKEAPKLSAGDDILERLAGVLKKSEAEPVAQPIAAPAAEEQPPFSQDEMTQIDAYIKDFPDVAKAEAMIRRVEYKAVTSYIFAEVARELQPLVQMVKTLSERTYLGDLQTAVPDYGTVRDKVIEWAQNQPPYLKAAYDHVIKNGTVDEVADLIKRYQTETGTKAPAAEAAKPQAELTPQVRRAVAALAPVTSKRSGGAAPVETADFDGAFEQFAKAG